MRIRRMTKRAQRRVLSELELLGGSRGGSGSPVIALVMIFLVFFVD